MTQPLPRSVQKQDQMQSETIKQILRTRIQQVFNHLPSSKCLYAHKQILNKINFVFDFKFQTTSMSGKIYEFIDNPEAVDVDAATNVLFFIYAKPQSMSTIVSIILHNESSFLKKEYFIYFVPAIDYQCQSELKRMGVWEKVKVRKLDFNFLPFTNSLLSLELPSHLTSIQMESSIVQGLLKLQFMRGSFKNIIGKGKISKSVLEYLETRRKEITQIVQKQEDDDLLIVLDRKNDLITPLLTGLSYECLLDFFFGIDMNRIDVPGQVFGNGKQNQTFLLNNPKDTVYSDICYMNINDVPTYIKKKAQQLKSIIEKKKNEAEKDYQKLNQLNNTLMVEFLLIQNHQCLVYYIRQKMKSVQFNDGLILESSILLNQNAETPFKYEDVEYLSLFYPPEHLLRLICLHSQTSDQSRYYSKNQKPIVEFLLNVQRIDHIPSLYNLVKSQILRETKYKNNFKQICDKFSLFPAQDQYDSYTDLNIIYSALSVKCVQLIMKNKLDPQRSSLIHKDTYFRGAIPKFTKNNTIYVMAIGGLSFNQINCFKKLEKSSKKTIKLLTTEILGSNKLVEKFMFDPLGS